ncbi:MAG: endonuclease III [Candidatus Eisenbacteria sp.]|nr:endonuclease III [Candidatus Eisenbacteria bacterium]
MQSRARRILAKLKKEFPDARTELEFADPFQLLIVTILAAQSTDVTVNKVTPGLFRKYPSPEAFARARPATLEREVHSTGFFRMKARAIIEASRDLMERFDGEVPADMDSLTSLRGVGRKTANVILSSAFGRPGIIVDTHVRRCSQRLGLSRNKDPDKIEIDLQRLIPRKDWSDFSHTLVLHGRYVCTARKPRCPECQLQDLCPTSRENAGA